MNKNSKIYVAGHTGMVGSAIVNRLLKDGYHNIIVRTHQDLDLMNQKDTIDFFMKEKPEYVFMAAAKVGGVYINSIEPADFFYQNILIGANTIHAAYQSGVKKLLYMGSGCIYPRLAPQPIKEEYLLAGELEKTNEAYAIAKISGIKMCEFYNKQFGTDFISCMPCNAYGPGDHFGLKESHVIPALIRKFHEAKKAGRDYVTVWGSGRPIREFIYIEDIADACLFLMEKYSGNECINIGTGTEYTIQDLSVFIQKVIGFEGKIENDLSKPDGTPRKLLDSSKLFQMGWKPQIDFSSGIKKTYQYYLENIEGNEQGLL